MKMATRFKFLHSNQSLLRYPGGKSRAVKGLRRYIPPHTSKMISPFMGGASFEIDCASRGVEVYASDNLTPLVNFWKWAKQDPQRMADRIERAYFPFDKSRYGEVREICLMTDDSFEQAVTFFVLNRESFSGITLMRKSTVSSSRVTPGIIQKLREFSAPNLHVQCQDYKEAIQDADCFMYLDPPYDMANIYGDGENRARFNHHELAEILSAKGNWMLSYNDTPLIRDLYKQYEFVSPKWEYCFHSRPGEKPKFNDVLILNT